MLNFNNPYLWTVRTHYTLERAGLVILNQTDCLEAGDLVMTGKIRGAGLKVACELYRAGGLGIFNIYDRMNGRLDLGKIRFLCEAMIDKSLHSIW